MALAHDDLQQILLHAWNYGHHFGPEVNRPGLQTDELLQLDAKHEIAQAMIRSVQVSRPDLEMIVQRIHDGRSLIVDGDPGPATLELIDPVLHPRCGCPDWGPGSGIHPSPTDDGWLNEYGEPLAIALSASPATTGTGSWVHSCQGGFQNIHAVIVAISRDSMQVRWLDRLNTLLGYLTNMQHEVGFHPIWRYEYDAVDANMRMRWQSLSGNILGWNQVPSSFRCGMTITGAISNSYSPSADSLLVRLFAHEAFGHGVGLGHFNATTSLPSIMNPSLTDGSMSWIGDRVESMMKRFFGGIRISPGQLPNWGYEEW